jgi:UDP-glucose 4-epimerase
MKAFVTGAAGFVGSNLVDRLLQRGDEVVAYDNLSTGMTEFLSEARKSARFSFVKADVLDQTALTMAMSGAEIVFHLAGNADVRFNTLYPRKDLELNTIATHNVLEAMRANGVKKIAFSSSGSVYGEAPVIPTPETCPFPIQTSLYAASKLAGEGLISAYCEGFGFQGWIFRFVSILGERYTHGHVFDFYKKLLENPHELVVLGNGKQRKSYLYVHDCISAIFTALDKAQDHVNVFNLGTDEYCDVNDSIGWITEALGLSPIRVYAGGDRGWIGDNPFIFLDTAKIRALGWKPELTIREAILRTLTDLKANRWVLDRRA